MASRDDFIKEVWPHAVREGQRIGVDPRIIVAQAALETGYGRSAPGNNYFGIKSHGKKGGNTLATTEVVGGKPVRTRASFRSYPDLPSSVAGYADFIASNPRYAAFREAEGLDAETAALQASGYATDPRYGAKVGAIAAGIDLPMPGAVPGQGSMDAPPDFAQQYQSGPMAPPPAWAQQQFPQPAPPQGAPAQAAEQMVAGAPGGMGGPAEVTVRPEAPVQGPPSAEMAYSEMVGHPVFHGGGGNYYFDDPLSGRSMPVNPNPQLLALVNAIRGGGNAAG